MLEWSNLGSIIAISGADALQSAAFTRTPLLPYFPLVIIFAQRHDEAAGLLPTGDAPRPRTEQVRPVTVRNGSRPERRP